MSASTESAGLLALLLGALWVGSAAGHDIGGTETESAPSPTRTVVVGYNGHSFAPNNTQANLGDTIEFSFWPNNHSVVRAEYMFPCVPYETTGTGKTGFWSGFYMVAEDVDNATTPRWRLTITDPNPIYFYSSGQDDCNKYGMVGGINVNSAMLHMQFDMSLDSPSVIQPAAASLAPPGPTTTGAAPAPASSTPEPISPAAIAGITLGAILTLATLGALLFWCLRRPPPSPQDGPGPGPGPGHCRAASTSTSHPHPHHPLHPLHPLHHHATATTGSCSCCPSDPPASTAASSDVATAPVSPARTTTTTTAVPPPLNLGLGPGVGMGLGVGLGPGFGCSGGGGGLVLDGDTIYVPVQRAAIVSAEYAASASSPGGAGSGHLLSDGESGVLRAGMGMLSLSPGPATPASVVSVVAGGSAGGVGGGDGMGGGGGGGGRRGVMRLGVGAGMGTGVLEGSGASLFPYNNDGFMMERMERPVEGRGAVAASNLRPSELAC